MQKFEYKRVRIVGKDEEIMKTLNEYGQQGWELVQVCLVSWHYFKRLID